MIKRLATRELKIRFGTFTETLYYDYERLKAQGITPSLRVNHGFTTSLYYDDPDGNQIELTVDNFRTKDECTEWVKSEKMAAAMRPPNFGEVFDPDDLARMFHAGASDAELSRIGIK